MASEELDLSIEEQTAVLLAIQSLLKEEEELEKCEPDSSSDGVATAIDTKNADRKARKAAEKAKKAEKYAAKQSRILDKAKAVSHGASAAPDMSTTLLPSWVRRVESVQDPDIQVLLTLARSSPNPSMISESRQP